MIHTFALEITWFSPLLCKLTAIYGSKKFDSHKWPTVFVDEVKATNTTQFRVILVWIIIFYI